MEPLKQKTLNLRLVATNPFQQASVNALQANSVYYVVNSTKIVDFSYYLVRTVPVNKTSLTYLRPTE